MSKAAIKVQKLSKRYRMGLRQERHDTLAATMLHMLRQPLNNLRRLRSLTRFDENDPNAEDVLWALRDMSFEVGRGDVVGVIGRNGAGKSTLLKILSRITMPTSGRIELHGRVSSLLEVGTGFHPELTGRENIYLNGTILGMRRTEIDYKLDEIIDFSGIEKFIDTPVKRYSSGMGVRLAFSVAAHLEPEILLVDEVLAVGDAEFQKKCLGKMGDVAQSGRTILFVSHNMGAIARLCSRSIWIEGGMINADGPTESVLAQYLLSDAELEGKMHWPHGFANRNVENFHFLSVTIHNEANQVSANLDIRKPFTVCIQYEIKEEIVGKSRIGFTIYTVDGLPIFEAYDSDTRSISQRQPGVYEAYCTIPGQLLNTGQYVLSLNAGIPNVINLAETGTILSFHIEDLGAVGSETLNKRVGLIRPELKWDQQIL